MSTQEHLKAASHQSTFFFRWASWVVRWRWLTLLISLLITLSSIFLVAPSHVLPPALADLRLQLLGRPGLIIDTSVDAFSDPNDLSVKVLERYRDLFGRDDYFMVMIEGDVFSLPYLEKLKEVHEELEQLNVEIKSLGERRGDRQARVSKGLATEEIVQAQDENSELDQGWGDEGDGWSDENESTVIEEVTSLINARRTRGTEDGLIIDKWCDPLPTIDMLPQLKEQILSDDTLVGQVVGERGQHSLILLRAHFMSEDDSIEVNKKVREVALKYHDPEAGFYVRLAGMPELNSTLKTTLLSTLRILLILSIILMIGMLGYQFRHPLGVVPPLIVVGIAALNTFAAMSILGMPVTMLSNILPAFIICVGVGDSVHLISVYRDQLKRCGDGPQAVIEAVSMTASPILFTSLTTIVGLLSFRFASIPAIQQMGTAGGLGVAAACFHSIFLLPALLTFNRESSLGLAQDNTDHEGAKTTVKKGDWIDRFIEWISDSSAGLSPEGLPRPETDQERKRRYITLWFCAGLTLISIVGATQLRVWHNPLAWLPDDVPTKSAFEIADREVGGTANVQLLIEGGPLGMKDLELLRGIESLEEHITSYVHPEYGDIIGNVINVNDVVKETRRALSGGVESAYRLPDTNEELSQLLFLFENTGPDQLRRLATNDLSSSQMTLRLKWLEATSYHGLTRHIEEGIRKYIPDQAKVYPTGAVYTLVSTVGTLLIDLVKSFGTALLVITLIMIFMLRGLKLGLISMVPNLIPILWLMGFMGFSGITIDMNNILIASIAIGLAVDDTIHLLHHFRVQYEATGDSYLAIHSSLKHAGRAMLITSTILTLGFFAYMAAEMKNIQIFGLLIGLCAALAMLIDLIFGPALLRTFYPRDPAKNAE